MKRIRKGNLKALLLVTLSIYVVWKLCIFFVEIFREPDPICYESPSYDNPAHFMRPARNQYESSEQVQQITHLLHRQYISDGVQGGDSNEVETVQAPPDELLFTSHCLPVPPFPSPPPVPLEDCEAPHVLMNDGGRLGNKMCQYLSLYLLRHLFGIRVSMTRNMQENLAKTFKNINLPVSDTACFTHKTTSITYHDLYRLLYNEGQRAAERNGFVNGSLISKSYHVSNYPCPRNLFLVYRDLLRDLLVYKEDVLDRAKYSIARAMSCVNQPHQNRTLVIVHVRRDDHIGYMMNHFNITALDQVYFQRAFNFYRKRLARPVFVVVSDDRWWCKVLTAPDVVVAGSKSAAVDQAVMSLGDHTVTSYGTFSFMGAIMAHGDFTHPSSDNPHYRSFLCTDSQYLHLIPRD